MFDQAFQSKFRLVIENGVSNPMCLESDILNLDIGVSFFHPFAAHFFGEENSKEGRYTILGYLEIG